MKDWKVGVTAVKPDPIIVFHSNAWQLGVDFKHHHIFLVISFNLL